MTRVIGLVQVKGGVGRSTVATTLAGELARIGSVALIDADMPQGTSASWAALRLQNRPADRLIAETVEGHRKLVAMVEGLRGKVPYIVIDGPPRIAEVTRAILALSDLALIPVGASPAEVWATTDMVPLVAEVQKVHKVPARILWTRFRAFTRLAQDLAAEADKALGLPAMRTTLGYRVAYAEALGRGVTAAELPDPNARDEVGALVTEVRRMVR
jgi:chromosome partitioning protein